jgi:arylesterase / paraoxonase
MLIAYATIAMAQAPNLQEETIYIGPGTEDIVLDTLNGQQRLLVSCSQRRKDLPKFGEIVALNIKDNSKDTLVRTGEPADLSFHPHGIDLVRSSNGAVLLFVVNHEETETGKRNSILLYEVKGKTLAFVRQQTDKTIVSPNDVAGLPDGEFYATNDSKRAKMGFGWLMEKLFKMRTSRIVYCNADGKCMNANDKKLAYANGILIVNDLVYVPTTQRKMLAEYSRQADGTLVYNRNIAKLNGLDNISLVNDQAVMVAAHPSTGKFLKHAKKPENLSPGIVYLVSIKKDKTDVLFTNDGSKISGNSVAVAFENTFYIGQVFEDWILKVTIPLPDGN